MATFRYGDKDLNVVYVDATMVASSGGTTPTLALNQLPIASSMVPNTAYICRRSNTALSWATANAPTVSGGAFAILIIGMPVAGDPLYDRVSTEAISAWGADSDQFAKLNFGAHTSVVNFNDIDDFGVHRMWFNTPHTGNNGTAKLYVTSISTIGQYFMTNCAWTMNTINLSGGSTGSSYENAWFRFSNARNAYIENNYIDIPSIYNSTAVNGAIAVYVDSCKNLYFNNNNIYSGSGGSTDWNYKSIYFSTIDNLDFQSNNLVLVGQNHTQCAFRPSFYTDGIGRCTIKNFNVTDRYMNLGTVTDSRTRTIFSLNKSGSTSNYTIIDNVNVNFTNLRMFSEYGLYLGIKSGTTLGYEHDYGKISNVCVSVPDSGGLSPYNASGVALYINGQMSTLVENISGICRSGSGITVNYVPTVKSAYCKGYFTSTGCSYIDLDVFYCDTITANIMSLIGCGTVHVKDVLLNSAWTTTKWISVVKDSTYSTPSPRTKVIIDQCNIPLKNLYTLTPDAYPGSVGIWGNNFSGIPNNYLGTNNLYEAQRYNVYRSESGYTTSIKFTGLSDSRNPLWISPPSLRGIEHTPDVVPSDILVTVYVAYKNYTNDVNLSKYLVILCEANESHNGIITKKTYDSTKDGKWVDDTSTWVNDTGLTIKRCEMVVKTTTSDPITTRIKFDWFTTNAYLYLDPVITYTTI